MLNFKMLWHLGSRKSEQPLRTRVGIRDAEQQFTLLLILYPALFSAVLLYLIAV